jgi:hypothetical protein
MAHKPTVSPRKQPHMAHPQPGDNPKKHGAIDVDDAQLDDVMDDRAFSDKPEDVDESEITDENQRSESRAEPRPPRLKK